MANEKLEYLRAQIRAEKISYFEIAELQSMVDLIDADDVELREWAGIPETVEKLSCLIPFSGFYESWHDVEFDTAIEMMFNSGGYLSSEQYGALQLRFWETIDWHAAQTAYASDYVSNFAAELGLKSVEFEEMVSPREYNFTTDRLFAKFDADELRALFARADVREMLDKVAADMFTSRSGFMSYYSPDVASWGADVSEWDANQRGALVHAAANVIIADGEEFDQEKECDLMESDRGNGAIDEYLWSNTTDNAVMGNRCDKVAKYLEKRATR